MADNRKDKPPKAPKPLKSVKPPKDPPNDPPKAAEPPPAQPQRKGWLDKFAPGVRRFVSQKREIPENLWEKCPQTGEMIYRPDLEAALWVTPSGYHMRIGPKLRFAYTFDEGRFEPIVAPTAADDPLKFVDDRSYAERLAQSRKTTGENDAVAIGFGAIEGCPAVVLVQDFAFMGGSLGMAAGEGFITAAEEAKRRGVPLVAFTAAGGARMQEGALSLMQMARTTLAIQELKRARLPYVVVLTDPTTGGVTASYAMLGDVHLAEPGALIGFAGARVIEQTIRETLPAGFQRAEYLVEKGMVDAVVPRRELRQTLGRILSPLMGGRSRLLAAE